MKKFAMIVISILMFSGILGVNTALPQAGQLNSVLAQFFNALKTGNLQILRSLSSDELIERRSKRLSNPRYSDFLKSIYGHAEFKVIDVQQIDNDQISVDIEVISDNQTQLTETITFIKKQEKWKLLKDRKDDRN